MNLNVNFNPNNLISATQIDFYPLKITNSIYFNLSSGMQVDSVKCFQYNITYVHTNDKLIINFSQAININQRLTVLIYYKGVPFITGFGSFVFSYQNGKPVAWSLSEPYGASDWFPCKNLPYDKADSSEVWITCRNDLKGISNGILFETLNNTDSTKTFKWKNKYSISPYLISIAVTDYSLYQQYYKYTDRDSMPVSHYIFPANLQNIRLQLEKTVKMLEVFSEEFGLYPFINEKYGHSEIGVSGGMEHQTCTSIGVFTENVIAHELAHQWWGDKITCRDWHHIWLNEGFATYSEGVYIEETQGKIAYNSFIGLNMYYAKMASGSLYCEDISNVGIIFDYYRTYAKGGVVLHILKGVLGDSVFKKCLYKYSNDTSVAYKTAVTEDFQRICERESNMNLAYFFNEWVYGAGYPKYQIFWDYAESGSGNYKVNLNVSQNSRNFFIMPVEIKVITTIEENNFRIFNDSNQQHFEFIVKGKPINLVFDPENKILKDKTGDETYPGINFKLYQNYPNPFNPKTTIEYEILKYGLVNISVYDILGRKVYELVNEVKRPGNYRIVFDGSEIGSGIYFYKLSTGEFNEVRKMVLVR